MTVLDSKVPGGPIAEWDKHKFEMKLVNPANKRKYKIIVVGTGLAGASAAATLGELGYNVDVLLLPRQPAPRALIAAQGGINAAKNYQNDGDSVYRLFYDTVKGGDFRSREANVYRWPQVSVNIIDQCVAQGVPFAREYGGYLANRSFGGAQVSRTFYARGQTGQQLLLGAYSGAEPQVAAGAVKMHAHRARDARPRGRRRQARGIVTRDLSTGKIELATPPTRWCSPPAATATSSTCRPTPWPATSPRPGRATSAARPSPTPATRRSTRPASRSGDYQSKLTLMSESLRNDGRIWVPKKKGDKRPDRHPRGRARLLPRAQVPELRQPGAARHRVARAKEGATRAAASARAASASTSTSPRRSSAWARRHRERYGNLFDMYERRSPARTPTRCRCASTRPRTTRWAASGSTTT
jgi:succinate dehydrogenase / fumarate reductase flavoprotein subunit